MNVFQMHNAEPLFQLTIDERAIAISALQTFTTTFPRDKVAERMLEKMQQTDRQMTVQRRER